ncbi:restriction endonuclease subunit S [Flavobacterium sp. LBUM151]
MAYPKYENYKESDIPWIGKIPEHWEQTLAKRIWKKESRPVRLEDEIVTAFRDGTVTLRKNKKPDGYTIALQEIGYQGIRKNDLVIHQMDAFAGAIGVSDSDGKSTPVYSACTPIFDANPFYYSYLLREMSRGKYILSLAKGIRERSTDFRFKMFGELNIPFPTESEQTAIANFIDYKLKLINRFISKKKQILLLSVERRKSITRQIINSNSVNFLRLSSITNLIERPIDRLDDNPFTPIGLYNRGRGVFHKPKTLGKDLGDSSFFKIKEGDVILSGQFAWEGSVALAKKSDEGCIASHRYPILECNENFVLPEFLFSFFTVSEGHFLLENNSIGAAGRNRPLNPRKLIKEKIPVPTLTEQRVLIEIIKSEITLKNIIDKEIALVEEYKTVLISEAVTGKIDVRNFKIPGVSEEESYEELEEELDMMAEESEEIQME